MLRTQQRRQKPTTIPENHNNLRLDSRRRQCPTISGSHAALRINFADSRAILNIFDTKAIVISTRQHPTIHPRTPLLGCY
jgi:hypothetical protein